MNAQRLTLPEIEISLGCCNDALRALLHSILLCRALGEVTPRAGTCRTYPTLSYAICPEADLEVEKIIERVKKDSERTFVGPDLSRAEIIVSFYEKRERSALLGLVSAEEKYFWEHWILPILINSRPPADIKREESAVRKNILTIASLVNERSDHLPHPPSDAIFPFEIKLTKDAESPTMNDGPWSLARMLQQARPPSLS